MPSSCSSTSTPKARRLCAIASMRSVSFTRSSLRVADLRLALGQRAGHGDDRQLVDDVGDLRAVDAHAAQLAAVDAAAGRSARRRNRKSSRSSARPCARARGAGRCACSFMPRLVSVRFEPGSAAAAVIQNAAEEKSPGTWKSCACSFEPPRTRTMRPLPSGVVSMTGGAWKWASRRSVWSRDGVISVTLVVPCAKRPASSRHDFNCALATGSVYSMPVSGAPSISSGAVCFSPRPWIFAPIWRSGSTMRFMGRLESEASPMSRLLNGCAGEHAGDQAHGGAGVAAFQRLERRLELAARAVHAQLGLGNDLDDAAHGLQRAHGAEAILARQKAGDGGRAVGQRGEKHGAVRQALVAGDGNFALDVADLADGKGGSGGAAHGWKGAGLARTISCPSIASAHSAHFPAV